MSNLSKIQKMLTLQDNINSKVSSTWRSNHNQWYRAIWMESAEMLEHNGWKWWKKQQCDMEQVQLELVDIWHFGLSIFLENNQEHHSELARMLECDLKVYLDNGPHNMDGFNVNVEKFVLNTIQTPNMFDIWGFCILMNQVGMDLDKLYVLYLSKNVLNMFRQDNGYKTGGYQKIWNDDKEDNQHLMDIIADMDINVGDVETLLYQKLEDCYKQFISKNIVT